MSIIVDTSVWSMALRRNSLNTLSPDVAILRELITNDQATFLGAIRQEILSGIRSVEQFSRLRDYLRAFPDLEIISEDYYPDITVEDILACIAYASNVVQRLPLASQFA
ncbi:MAG: hypothetical protein MUE54_07740 [Anaerolineae bacterium]|nr:hypothetical protein [Anaerolineae bacterium]